MFAILKNQLKWTRFSSDPESTVSDLDEVWRSFWCYKSRASLKHVYEKGVVGANVQVKGFSQCSLFYLNIRSAHNKEDELCVLCRDYAFIFDVIMLTEIGTQATLKCLKDYASFFLNCEIWREGGFLLQMKNKFQCKLLTCFSHITIWRWNFNSKK